MKQLNLTHILCFLYVCYFYDFDFFYNTQPLIYTSILWTWRFGLSNITPAITNLYTKLNLAQGKIGHDRVFDNTGVVQKEKQGQNDDLIYQMSTISYTSWMHYTWSCYEPTCYHPVITTYCSMSLDDHMEFCIISFNQCSAPRGV